MKRGTSIILAASTGFLLVTGQPGFGQGVPTTDDIVRALRPVPSALRGGQQGLPTIGAPVRPEPNSNLTNASTAGGLVNPAKRAAPPAPQQEHAIAAAVTSSAAPPGCPAAADIVGQPLINFKVAFEFGSARLRPDAVQVLRNLGKALNEGLSDQHLFGIEGHTDAVGSLNYNQRLSMARAQAVKDFLIHEMGVSPQRLTSAGKAFCEPLDPTDPKGAENRRVVVVNQTKTS